MNTKTRSIVMGLAVTLAGFSSASVFAHHSMAMFDLQKEVTLSGTVKEFQWTNPHSWVQLMVTDANGNTKEWSLETQSPAGLKKRGWTRDSVKAGDKATAVFHPLKDGTLGGGLVTLTINGKVIGEPEQ